MLRHIPTVRTPMTRQPDQHERSALNQVAYALQLEGISCVNPAWVWARAEACYAVGVPAQYMQLMPPYFEFHYIVPITSRYGRTEIRRVYVVALSQSPGCATTTCDPTAPIPPLPGSGTMNMLVTPVVVVDSLAPFI